MLTALRRARRSLPLGLRSDAVELLDGDGLSRAEIERNLADLARLGRLPGGAAASVAGVRRLVGGRRDVRVLDAGAGRGDLPIAFARNGWTTVAVDRHPEVLRIARRETAAEPRVEVVDADVRALPFDDDSFDVSHSSLLMHHMDPRGVVGALRELRRVARHGVVINDLRRGILPLVATALSVTALGGSHVTRNDSIVSARRAYTLEELDDLLGEAGLSVAWRSRAWMPRVVTAATETAGA
jgi:ubiquinone/menaquinone biosynthesis C-methylase UbiE